MSTQEKLEKILAKLKYEAAVGLYKLLDEAYEDGYKQGYIDAGIDIINRQAKEGKLSACCGAEITETGFCTDCKDNC